jgi:hypothetical protein
MSWRLLAVDHAGGVRAEPVPLPNAAAPGLL